MSTGPLPEPGPSAADHATECRFCPLCQAMSVLRQVRPDTVDQLVAALTDLVVVVRELAGGLVAGTGSAPVPEPARSEADGPPRVRDETAPGAAGSAPRVRDQRAVVRIDVTD